MEDLPTASYYENLKRYLRRRRYQRLISSSSTHSYRRNIRVSRLGSPPSWSNRGRRLWMIRRITRVKLMKLVSPIKVLSKFHEAYVNMMTHLANKMSNSSSDKVTRGRRHVVALVSSGEQVDSKLAMEIYKRISASRQSQSNSTDLLSTF